MFVKGVNSKGAEQNLLEARMTSGALVSIKVDIFNMKLLSHT